MERRSFLVQKEAGMHISMQAVIEETPPSSLDGKMMVLCSGGGPNSLFSQVAVDGCHPGPPNSALRTWAQFFLKYVISHPVVTCAIPGSTKLTHLEDNQAGLGKSRTHRHARRWKKPSRQVHEGYRDEYESNFTKR
jgi:predicted aldo/keto reductase-like oxidoreductase